jgi:iron complex transport system substrate-binding protein
LRIAERLLSREKRADDVVTYIESLRKDMRTRTMNMSLTSRPAGYVGGIGYHGSHGIESAEQHYIPFEWISVDNVADRIEVTIGSHV